MKDSALLTAMTYLNDEYIAEAAPTAATPMKRIRRRLAMKWTSVAAGFCAAFLLAWHVVIPYIRYLTLPDVPTYDDALYSAGEIASLFGVYDNSGVGTTSYTKVYAPSAEYLGISEIPTDEYIAIYELKEVTTGLNETEFTAFADECLTSVSAAVNISKPAYEVKREEATSYSEARLRAAFGNAQETDYRFSVGQEELGNYFTFRSASSLGKIALNGVPVEVDQTQSDDEIMASLGEVRAQLFSVFDVAFEDVKIVREYNEYSEYGVGHLSIYFYNAADHPLNEYMRLPLSDYICLDFDNFENYSGDVVSKTVLSNVSIKYRQYRTDDVYTVSKRVRMISLEEAERLLYKGYVFGGHSCPICMSQQSEVDFEGYDLVGLTYVFGYDSNTGSENEGIPFYTFYKKIGTSRNGNQTYAMTYVPAVEVSGYEAYFESQRESHRGRVYADTQ